MTKDELKERLDAIGLKEEVILNWFNKPQTRDSYKKQKESIHRALDESRSIAEYVASLDEYGVIRDYYRSSMSITISDIKIAEEEYEKAQRLKELETYMSRPRWHSVAVQPPKEGWYPCRVTGLVWQDTCNKTVRFDGLDWEHHTPTHWYGSTK